MSYPEEYRNKFWDYLKTQTGIYWDKYLNSDPFFYTYNTENDCAEAVDFNSLERFQLSKNDFEEFWDKMDDPEFKKIESLKKLEDKWKFVWWITRNLLR